MEQEPMHSFPIDRSEWTADSRRCHGPYDQWATEYEGIRHYCLDCCQSFVFTPAEQKQAFEVDKRFVEYRPKYCPACRLKQRA
jgi:hypothetical protein